MIGNCVRHFVTDSVKFGQGLRFVLAGGTVALLYIVTTLVMAEGLGLPFQIALALGFAAAIVAHFSLQRFFVWVHHQGFALPFRSQVRRYALVAGVQYVTTAAVTASAPRLLGMSSTVVYIVWTPLVSAVTFLIFGRGVFHAEVAEVDPG
jgi:putative flippase GtrA